MSAAQTLYQQYEAAAIQAARANNASLWYVGNDPTGFVWQDSAGTVPATGTDPIGRLTDRAGSNAATQSTAANKPTLELQANGYFWEKYDGVNDVMTDTLPASMAGACTLIVAARVTSTAATRTIATAGASVSGQQRVSQIRIETNGHLTVYWVNDAGTAPNRERIGSLLNTTFVAATTSDGTTGRLFFDSAQVGATVTIPGGATTVTNGVHGDRLTSGATEPLLGYKILTCKCLSVMPASDMATINAFAKLLGGIA